MAETKAPYNFVPLNGRVFFPQLEGWEDIVSHDRPLRNGFSGTIDCTLMSTSPILVGGDRTKSEISVGEVKMFRTPEGNNSYAIPGSSLRGMIRNVLEIASFGKMSNRSVADTRFQYRDSDRRKKFYPNSVHDFINNRTSQHFLDRPDLAEIIFGYLPRHKNLKGVKSRAHFGLAKCVSKNPKLTKMKETVLGGPKASYFPNYLEQPQNASQGYKTYMHEDGVIRGWKRYPTGGNVGLGVPPEKTGVKSKVALEFLPAGTSFQFTLHLHNLLAEELGAILWAITWGNNSKLRHKLGMAKGFGMGELKINLDKASFIPNFKNHSIHDLRVGYFIEKYTALMNMFVSVVSKGHNKNFLQTDQLTELLAMADPENSSENNLSYMTLEQHLSAKRNKAVLPRYKKLK